MLDFSLLPLWYQLMVVGIFGAIMASFINVVAYRMHTNASLSGRSRCFSCGHDLEWYELIPVFSYLVLRGRCKACGAGIAIRDLLVEIAMAGMFILLYLSFDSFWIFVLSALLSVLLCAIILYDITHLIIPNELVIAVSGVAAAILAVTWSDAFSLSMAIEAISAAAICFSVYAGLWYMSQGKWIGFGDAKLALPLGALLSPLGAFSMIVLSFWVGAFIAVSALVYQKIAQSITYHRGYARGGAHASYQSLTMKSEIPFAPFLIIAFALVYIFGVDVLSFVSYVLGQ